VVFLRLFLSTAATTSEKVDPAHVDLCIKHDAAKFIVITLVHVLEALRVRITDYSNQNVKHEKGNAETENVENAILTFIPIGEQELPEQTLVRTLKAVVIDVVYFFEFFFNSSVRVCVLFYELTHVECVGEGKNHEDQHD
jgi:hypothetical protein